MTSDAFGNACLDCWDNGRGPTAVVQHLEFDSHEIIEDPLATYFWTYPDWSLPELRAISNARGNVLDIGVGAGRYAIELQCRGLVVTGVDISKGAVEVARSRGLADVKVASAESFLVSSRSTFDTVLMMGNNFGLMGRTAGIAPFLRILAARVSPGGKLIGSLGVPAALPPTVCEANVRAGREEGEVRMRSRYGDAVGDWFDYLFLQEREFVEHTSGTGWRVDDCIVQNEFENLFCLTRL